MSSFPAQVQMLPLVILVALLNLLPLPAAATHTPAAAASAAAITYPNFQHLNVKGDITAAGTTATATQHGHSQQFNDFPAAKKSDGKWTSLEVFHRDRLPSASPSIDRFRRRMERDSKRVASLRKRIDLKFNTNQAEDLGSDVISGMDEGSGEYFVRIGVGSPPRDQYVVIDSGSDIVWVQCMPCDPCYPQSDPLFDPATSASFAAVPCSSDACRRIDGSGCQSGGCRYAINYGDGSYTAGTLILETLTLGGTAIRGVAIGCGHRNRGLFVGAAGLLGLGGGSMSFVGQLGGQTGGAFSYCLVSRGTNASGSLALGRDAMPPGAAWIPLVRNPGRPSYYYVGLSGVGVGGERVPIPEEVFEMTEAGDGGVVMDTGTAVTRFPAAAYEAFRDAFAGKTAELPRAGGVSIFDTCYDLSGFVSVRVPTVSFYFSGGGSGPGPMMLTLPARNFLIPVDEVGTFCFAFAPSESALSIIGNVQQEGIQISVDGANGFVGFGPNIC